MKKTVKKHYTAGNHIFLLIFLLIEIIMRPLLQPDPWLLESSHWYFYQPLRLLIEFSIVLILFFILAYSDKNKLKISKNQLSLLIISSLASIFIFSFMEFKQLQASLSVDTIIWITWFFTGFFIGVGQEFIYRGLLYNYLINRYSLMFTWTAVSILFVFMPLHSFRLWDYFQSGDFNVILILSLIYAGTSVLFLWLRKETQTVIIPGIVHGLGNAITWVAVFALL